MALMKVTLVAIVFALIACNGKVFEFFCSLDKSFLWHAM